MSKFGKMGHSLVCIMLALMLSLSCVAESIVPDATEQTAQEIPETTDAIKPSEEPSLEPTVEPTIEPTVEPTIEPTVEPTIEPTVEPTIEPTVEPTIEPTVEPTIEPTVEPALEPTIEPTIEPTVEPTEEPAAAPEEEILEADLSLAENVASRATDGWSVDEAGYYYYTLNGQLVKKQILMIDGKYYAFDESGRMYENVVLSMFCAETGKIEWYRAGNGGALETNTWHLDMYYLEDGRRASGICEIDGVLHYFDPDNGSMCRDRIVTENGVEYFVDDDGICTPVSRYAGWIGTNAHWYYVADDACLRSTVIKLNGSFYGFDADGRMYDGVAFTLVDPQTGASYDYLAKKGGVLYANEWMNVRYFDENARALKGIQTVDGVTYYFDESGNRMYEGLIKVDGVNYVVSNCVAVSVGSDDGWKTVAGKTYYVYQGDFARNMVIKIDGDYYGFNSEYQLYSGGVFEIYNNETGESYRYYAKADGTLYVNTWYDSGSSLYYYGEDARLVTGLYTIDGNLYYFGAYYGECYMNRDFTLTDDASGVTTAYRAKADGALYVNEWYEDENGYRYYYGENGVRASGLTAIGSSQYYFGPDSGRCSVNTTILLDGVRYICDANGVATRLAYDNGWYEDDSGRYYIRDGAFIVNEVAKIDGKYYGFDADGRLWIGAAFTAYNPEIGTTASHRARTDGTLYTSEWFVDANGERYYYGANGAANTGICQTDGDYYYFNASGMVVISEDAIAVRLDDEDRIGYCRSKADGTLYVCEWYADGDGNRYYYGEGGVSAWALQQVEGSLYYFDQDGRMITNILVTVDGVQYAVGANGIAESLEGRTCWVNSGDKRGYVRDGALVKNAVIEIVDGYYGFDDDGWLYVDCTFGLNNAYYRAHENGKLYENEWCKENQQNWWYYGRQGRAANGLQTVDGTIYYFVNGLREIDTAVVVDGKYYVIDANGSVAEVSSGDGWKQANGQRYYVNYGSFVVDDVLLIDGAYYGFNSAGCLIVGEPFNMYRPALAGFFWYRANANGVLLVDKWYRAENGDWYYYATAGRAPQGLYWVNGAAYYFDEEGRMLTDVVKATGSGVYYFDANGVGRSCTGKTGWLKIGKDYFYIQNGELLMNTVAWINGAYYAFDEDGRMFCNQVLQAYDSEEHRYVYFRAKSSGALCRNEWFKDAYGDWYYYDEYCEAVSGVVTINGTCYCFDEDCRMMADIIVATDDGTIYAINASGAAVNISGKTAWFQVGGDWFYVLNGKLLTNTIRQINGAYYGFDADGRMYANCRFSMENGAATNWYQAQANGALYEAKWVQVGDDWYYYRADGSAASGILSVSGTIYYFDATGKMLTDLLVTVGSANYIVDEDGKATNAGTADGWRTFRGAACCYVYEGVFARNRIVKVGSVYYGFDDSCLLYTDTAFTIGDRSYLAKGDGALYVGEWYRRDGDSFYYDAQGVRVTGLQTIQGGLYYFDADGRLVCDAVVDLDGQGYYFNGSGEGIALSNDGWQEIGDDWYYVLNGALVHDRILQIEGSYYAFDGYRMLKDGLGCIGGEYCCARENGQLYTSAWREVRFRKYYFDSQGRALKGIGKVGGVSYCFDDQGRLMTGCLTEYGGALYIVDEEGVASKMDSADGWKQCAGSSYYVKNGQLLRNSVELIAGAYYGFDVAGCMYSSASFELNGSYYRAKADGRLYAEEWYASANRKYYYDWQGRMLRDSMIRIDGFYYYFGSDGVMRANCLVVSGGVHYIADENGRCAQLDQGWVQDPESKRYKYIDEDGYVENDVREIDGALYAFDDEGWLIQNTLFEAYVSETETRWFIAQESGALYVKQGWKSFNGRWYYVTQSGSLYEGILSDNGKLYEMLPEMRALGSDTTLSENGELKFIAVVGKDGVLQPGKANGFYRVCFEGENIVCGILNGKILKNQWLQLGKTWYYFGKNGGRYENGVYTINNALYYFSEDGRMQSGCMVRDSVNGATYYANASGALARGEATVDGQKYYFDPETGAMCTGCVYDGDKIHIFGEDGVWLGDASSEGWNQIGGRSYYVKNGKVLTDCVIQGSGDKRYVLGTDGAMLASRICWLNGTGYLLDATGAATTGWQQFDGAWYYGDLSNCALRCAGEFKIDGEIYRFRADGSMVAGDWVQDGQLYRYASNGVRAAVIDLNGWTYAGGNAYYYKDGEPYTGWLEDHYIDGGLMCAGDVFEIGEGDLQNSYYFDEYGRVVRGEWIYDQAYAQSDGVLAEDEWMTIDGSTYYFDGCIKVTGEYWIGTVCHFFDADGKYLGVDPSRYASGKKEHTWVLLNGDYYYSYEGYYLHNTVAKINGAWYCFDDSGRMYADEFVYLNDFNNGDSGYRGYRYCASSGAMVVSESWKQIGGDWYYFDDNGEAREGWRRINGVQYYFDWPDDREVECPVMVTGYHTIDGMVYYFGTNGALSSTRPVNVQEGWFTTADGEKYYFRNGRAVEAGIYTIDGKLYGFDAQGRLVKNDMTYVVSGDDMSLYLTDANGCVITQSGWRKIEDYSFYVGADGQLYRDGLYMIGGTLYAFDLLGILVG